MESAIAALKQVPRTPSEPHYGKDSTPTPTREECREGMDRAREILRNAGMLPEPGALDDADNPLGDISALKIEDVVS